jgi:hypothetical protein
VLINTADKNKQLLHTNIFQSVKPIKLLLQVATLIKMFKQRIPKYTNEHVTYTCSNSNNFDSNIFEVLLDIISYGLTQS